MAAMTDEDYLRQLQALLPPGRAWPRTNDATLTKLLRAMAKELARVDQRVADLIDESDPRTTREMLADWERVCGLPDTCSASVATTLQERRAAVEAKLTARGGQSKAYYTALAAKLGYAIEIDNFRPFICGISRCGQVLNGGPRVRYQWRVRVLGPRYTAFRTGASQCGDLLGKVTRADDLECKLQRLKPGYSRLIVSYEGA